jgi:hypothetical protein
MEEGIPIIMALAMTKNCKSSTFVHYFSEISVSSLLVGLSSSWSATQSQWPISIFEYLEYCDAAFMAPNLL